MKLSVKALQKEEVPAIVDYFLNSVPDFLDKMGVDASRLPEGEHWIKSIEGDLDKPPMDKSMYYLLWLLNDKPIGHCNINKIKYGDCAYLHLHIWEGSNRMKGLGASFLKASIPIFFDKFRLNKIYSEPASDNPAPNKTLSSLRFDLVKTYNTTPGLINWFQKVNQWCLYSGTPEETKI